jgi:CheY-like chemotaxis protein
MTLRCLVVDDSTGFLRSARTLLEREGVAVVGVATSGAEAVPRTRELNPDVVLLDVELGSESGFDVTDLLVREAGLPASSVIMISAHSEDDLEDLLAACPAAGFIPKAKISAAAIERLLAAS